MVPSIDQLLDPRSLLVVGAFVAVVLVAVAFLLGREVERRSRTGGQAAAKPRRLALVESLDLDAHRRLVILRRDAVEHLVIVGGPSDIVVETAMGRATGELRADAPPLRGVRTEPDESRGLRASPFLTEEPALVREPVPILPQRSPEPAASRGAEHVPPPVAGPSAHAPFRAPSSSSAGESRAASPVPPRRTVPPPGSVTGHFVHHRAPAVPPTKPPPVAEPARENTPSAPPRSLATPVLRSPPPVLPSEPEPKPADSDRVDAPVASPATDPGSGEASVPPADETVVSGPGEPSDAKGAEPARTEADATADRPQEPQSSPEAEVEGGRDPIDRLEAEIARLLGRASADP